MQSYRYTYAMTQNAQSLYQQARALHHNGELSAAKALYQQVIALAPNQADALHMLGLVCYQLNAFNEAVTHIANALKLQPKNLDYLNNYGLALLANNETEAALKSFQQALLLQPKDLDVQLNLGNTLLELARFEEAAGYYRRLLRLQPKRDDVRAALCHCLAKVGNSAHAQGHFKLAESAFSEAVLFNAQEPAYFYNLANAQRELNNPKAALSHYQKALALNPNDADTHNNLGNVQRELGQLDLAVASYQKALQLNSNLHHALVHLVHQKQHICDWSNLEHAIATIRSWVNTTSSAQVSPFAFLAMPSTTAQEQQLCASRWVSQRYSGHLNQAYVHTHEKTPYQVAQAKKLKIGYLSADFRLHPLAFLITELIEKHDRAQFDVIGFSYGVNDQSAARKRLEKAFTQFYDIKDWSETESASKIHALGIDILVDLTGFTQNSRTGIVALNPAPISINWLGFAGTMGHFASDHKTNVPLFNYLLTDNVITPENQAQFYSEKLLHLPCYQANNSQRPVATVPDRASCDLPEGAFVFCCFNQTFKITEAVFAVWMQLLHDVPNSVLWLLACNPWAKENLMTEANKRGIAKERLIFAPRVAIEAHLARHSHADLFLDTLPYNAHTTCSDALWMGLPVLTAMGDTFASRVAASLIQAAGLDKAETKILITKDLAQYYQQARWLAQNPHALSAIKTRLLSAKETSRLFDTASMVSALEQNYQAIWAAHHATDGNLSA